MFTGFHVPTHVAGETVDGETIVIDLVTGAYHTLEGVAARTWDELHGPAEVGTDPERLVALATFVASGLLETTRPDDLPAPVDPEAIGLVSYTDMAQLLLADPVHDVDDRGWPILRQP